MTDNRIEQVKKILENKNISVSVSVLDYSKGEIKPAKDTFCGTIVSSDVDKLSKEIVSALYSEPQVCPKPEQMMICPSYPEQDKSLCSQCHHFHEHVFEKGTCDRHLTYCKGCIPVPSTPASIPLPPDELLTDEESFNLGFKTSYKAESTELFAYSEGVQDGAKAQLLKCHQSEAAEIASLQADEARIKELEDKLKLTDYDRRITLHETWYWMGDGEDHLESLECPVIINADDLRDLIAQARADQNKKIGEEMMRHVRAESGLPPRWVADLIAKLQKGEI